MRANDLVAYLPRIADRFKRCPSRSRAELEYGQSLPQGSNRDRGPLRSGTPPAPPGIRVRTTAVRLLEPSAATRPGFR
jgi:hypothetical protein